MGRLTDLIKNDMKPALGEMDRLGGTQHSGDRIGGFGHIGILHMKARLHLWRGGASFGNMHENA